MYPLSQIVNSDRHLQDIPRFFSHASNHFRWLRISLIVLGIMACTACAQQSDPLKHLASGTPSTADQVVPGEVIVQFHQEVSQSRVEQVLSEAHVEIIKNLRPPLIFLVRPLGGRTAQQAITSLQQFREVQYAEPNRLYKLYSPSRELPKGTGE